MLCAISGEAPRKPVASRKSGNVFEKRLIEAHIAEHHTDPVTGEDLATEDLIELISPRVVTPRPPNLTSIPALLSAFQNEWDAIVLETHTLKQQLAQTRQELSTALYQNDAAVRVIARLSKERDEAREALSNVTVSGGAANGDAMQVDGQALPEDLVAQVDSTQQQLFATRRKRLIPEGWVTGEKCATFDVSTTTDAFYLGANTLAIDESGDKALVGGPEGVAYVYSVSGGELAYTLKTSGRVTAVAWDGNRAFVATSQGAVKVFQESNQVGEVGFHAGAVVSVAVHPSRAILATAGVDKRFALHDLSTYKTVSQIPVEAEISVISFHVDGLLLFVGSTDGKIRIFDVKTGASMAELETGSPVHAISFSENGTWFAVAQKDSSSVSIWDIRKQNVIKVLEAGGPVDSIVWDYTGQFLAIAGPAGVSVQQYVKASKSWAEPVRRAVQANDVAWGAMGQSLVALNTQGGLSILSAS